MRIEDVRADEKTYDARDGLQLPARVRDVRIDYTALTFVAPTKVRFRYPLVGQDPGLARGSGYPAGTVFKSRVRATTGSALLLATIGACGTRLVHRFDFSVDPAYYQTSWFRASCVAAFLTMIWAIYRVRVRVLHERHRVLEQYQGEISALNERLMKAHEEERRRIAGELHDGILQQITSLTLRLGTAMFKLPPDSEAKTRIRESQKELIKLGTEIRHLSHELHPAVLEETGLPLVLSSYCEEFGKVRGIPVLCESDASVDELSTGAALYLDRIAQEALGNVAKHAKATQVEVRLSRSDGNVCLSVSDDGVGFSRDGNPEGWG